MVKEDKNIITIDFPEIKKLKEKIARLKDKISNILLEKDELVYVICKNIKMKYTIQLGGLEYKAYHLSCQYLRLKRKIQLIQASKNKQEKINISEVENILDKEFEEYKKRLEEEMEKLKEALKRKDGEVLSEEDTKEIKKLYREIVRNIHPDLNPNVNNETKELLQDAITAYKNADLDRIRLIALLSENSNKDYEKIKTEDVLINEKNRIESSINTLYKEFERKKEELNKLVSDYNLYIKEMKLKIKELLR